MSKQPTTEAPNDQSKWDPDAGRWVDRPDDHGRGGTMEAQEVRNAIGELTDAWDDFEMGAWSPERLRNAADDLATKMDLLSRSTRPSFHICA